MSHVKHFYIFLEYICGSYFIINNNGKEPTYIMLLQRDNFKVNVDKNIREQLQEFSIFVYNFLNLG